MRGWFPRRLLIATRRLHHVAQSLHERASNVGAYLAKRGGVRMGERVGVMLPNTTEVLESHYSIPGMARGVVLNLNQRLAPIELGYILQDAQPRWLIAAAEFQGLVEESIKCR